MKPRSSRILGWSAAIVALAAVFAAYLNPHRMVELAGRIWACF